MAKVITGQVRRRAESGYSTVATVEVIRVGTENAAYGYTFQLYDAIIGEPFGVWSGKGIEWDYPTLLNLCNCTPGYPCTSPGATHRSNCPLTDSERRIYDALNERIRVLETALRSVVVLCQNKKALLPEGTRSFTKAEAIACDALAGGYDSGTLIIKEDGKAVPWKAGT